MFLLTQQCQVPGVASEDIWGCFLPWAEPTRSFTRETLVYAAMLASDGRLFGGDENRAFQPCFWILAIT